jgi:hypothetical protein
MIESTGLSFSLPGCYHAARLMSKLSARHILLLILLATAALLQSSRAAEPLLTLAGYRVFTIHRELTNGLAEEQVIVRKRSASLPAWKSPWGHGTTVAAYAREGVAQNDLRPDIIGDGVPKLYVWVTQDAQDFSASLTVLRLGTNIETIAALPFSPAEGPKVERGRSGRTRIRVTEFVSLCEGNPVDLPTYTINLQWTNGAFHYLPDWRRQHTAKTEELAANADRIRKLFNCAPNKEMNADGTPWALLSEATQLAWHGHESEAIDLMRKAWPPERVDQKDYETKFLKELRSNPWFREMKAEERNHQNSVHGSHSIP